MALLAITRRARVRRGEEPTRSAAGAAPAVLIGASKGTTTPPTGIMETHTSTLTPPVFNWSDSVVPTVADKNKTKPKLTGMLDQIEDFSRQWNTEPVLQHGKLPRKRRLCSAGMNLSWALDGHRVVPAGHGAFIVIDALAFYVGLV